jgi:hypothetical protein
MKGKFALPVLLVIFTVTCKKYPDSSDLAGRYVVITNYSDKANFTGYATFVIPAYVGLISNTSRDTVLDPRFADQILASIRKHLKARGYEEAPNNHQADLGIAVEVLQDVSMYSNWYPGSWWGYPGWSGCYWHHCGTYPVYPSNYPVYEYNSGSLIIELVDLKNLPLQNNLLNVIWTNWNGGALGPAGSDVDLVIGAIDQAFLQSPYIKAL